MTITSKSVNDLADRIGVTFTTAHQLLLLAGGDVELAEDASNRSNGLDQCKATIIDRRFRQLEENVENWM